MRSIEDPPVDLLGVPPRVRQARPDPVRLAVLERSVEPIGQGASEALAGRHRLASSTWPSIASGALVGYWSFPAQGPSERPEARDDPGDVHPRQSSRRGSICPAPTRRRRATSTRPVRLEGRREPGPAVRRVRDGEARRPRRRRDRASTQSPGSPRPGTSTSGPTMPTAWRPGCRPLAGPSSAAPFDVGDQGRMRSSRTRPARTSRRWQPTAMGGFEIGRANAYGWAELSARGLDQDIPFYSEVFGWTTRTSDMGEDQPPYTEFLLDGRSVAGAMEMNPMVPAAGAELLAGLLQRRRRGRRRTAGHRRRRAGDVGPGDFPGGRFADPHRPAGRRVRAAQAERTR